MKKHKLSCASAFLALLALCASCSESDGPGNLEPTLWMDAPTAMTRTTAVLHGHVARTAHSDLPSLTFRVSEDKMATADGTAGGIQQTFTSPVLTVEGDSVSWMVSGLTAGRRYTCVLQGRHGEAELQSNAVSFATLPNSRPALTAPVLLSCGPTSAILAYTVTDTGGEAVTATGVYCVNGATGQTTTLTVDPDSAVQHRARLCAGPLSQNTSYRFVAFAENSVGRTESAPLAFTTGSTVMLNAPGDLSLLMSSDLYSHTRLAFSGKMNGDDLRCLRRMMGRDEDGTPTAGQLTDVDLTEVTIVAGGDSYGSGRYAVADVVGYSLFADCDRLTRLLLPTSATTLEKDALQGCSALREPHHPRFSLQCHSLIGLHVVDCHLGQWSQRPLCQHRWSALQQGCHASRVVPHGQDGRLHAALHRHRRGRLCLPAVPCDPFRAAFCADDAGPCRLLRQ